MNHQNYQKTLASLNDKQRQAVETIYGPVMVLAGPWSGKTQLLSARIAHILQSTDYFWENILCLTFTENAAKNMRERLASMIGQDAYKVHIMTFHSFGNEIIQRFRSYSEGYIESEILDELTASSILDRILEALAWNHPYKPWYRATEIIREVLGNIRDIKSAGLTPNKFREILTLNDEVLKIFSSVFKKYWSQIESLGRSKVDGQKKIELFWELQAETERLASEYPRKIHGYENLLLSFASSMQEALELCVSEGSPKFITAWRDSSTEKNTQWKRVLKESVKSEKLFALADIYGLYQTELEKWGYIDFSDMILEGLRLLETEPTIRLSLAEKYQVIMIDEFQDTNEAQMKLIDIIASVETESPNIFVVGDDDQSIYKFQGANIKNIRDFTESYHWTELIILEKNYRSQSEIIEASRSLLSGTHSIADIFPGREKYFTSEKWAGGEVQKLHFKTELEEISAIVSDIEQKIASWVAPQDIAIITKKNKSLDIFAKALLQKNIPVSVSKEESLFELEEMRLLISILKLLVNIDTEYKYEDGELLLEILSHPAFGIHRLKLWELSKTVYHARHPHTCSLIEQLRIHSDTSLQHIGHFLIELAQRARYERLEDIIDYITWGNTLLYEDEYSDDTTKNDLQITLFSEEKKSYISPYFQYFFENKREWVLYARHLAHLKKFIDVVRSFKKQKEFLHLRDATEILSLIEKYGIHIKASTLIGNESNSVSCITVHKAKWLEWKYVYVPFLTNSEYKQGRFGGSSFPKNLPLQAEKDNMEDIERLVYTAATRAELFLSLSYSDISISEKSLDVLPNIWSESGDYEERQFAETITLSETLESDLSSLVSLPFISEEESFLRERIEKNFRMNVSALQNFLDITSWGPVSFVKRSLLRFPQAKNIAACYGTAMHEWLEHFFTDYKRTGLFSKDILLSKFEESLTKEGFSEDILRDYLERGRENLLALYPEISGKKYHQLELEYNFSLMGGVWLPREGSDAIQLTWKIDKVEILEDDSLIITDFKTGKWFESFDFKWAEYLKVKQWKYHLQLAFYAVLFELSPRFAMYGRKQYELFFVEKNQKDDTLYRINEYIQDGEKERTKALIKAVMSKIEHLNFPDTSHYPQTLAGIRQFEEDLLEGRV